MTSTSESPEILIVAAEASSSLYAQRLLQHWKSQGRPVKAFGIGSRDMEALGFEILGRSEDLAVVGIQEVMAHWGDIKGAFHRLVEAAKVRKPKVALLLDYPDFNLRLAKKLKALGVKVVYYISPQVWAWRQGRVKLIRKVVDKMLVVFPFETEFYERNQVPVEFVGHPLLDEINGDLTDEKARATARAKYGIGPNDILLGLMPGSRYSELKHHLELQLACAKELVIDDPNLKIALFVAPTFSKEQIKSRLPQLDFPLILIQDEPFQMISLADVVLCASGTATLMVGLMDRPMVIMYRMNGLSAFLAKAFVKSTPHFGLINLVLGERVVPELFQEQASLPELVRHLKPLLKDAQARGEIAKKLDAAKTRLGRRGATLRVAKALEDLWSAT